MSTIHTDRPGGQGCGDQLELGRQALPSQRQAGTHGPADLDPLPRGIAGDVGDPLHQFGRGAAALPGGQATLTQLVTGGLRHFPRGQHPQGVGAPAQAFRRRQHTEQIVLRQTGQLARIQGGGQLIGDRIQHCGEVVHTPNFATPHRHNSQISTIGGELV